MKTLTLSPELNNDKEARRQAYVPHRQDHGTRRMGYDKDYFGKPAHEIKAAESARISFDDQLDHMSSRQLEKAASDILAAAGFEEPASGGSHTSETEQYTLVSGQTETNPDTEFDDYDSLIFTDSFEDEVRGVLAARRKQAMNANRVYEGHIDPSDDIGDFVDGLNVRDRP